jgi:hypothetical protein
VTELVERYRQNAEKCLQLVQSFNDPDAKRSLLAMANAWLTLAAQREKNIEATSADEPTSPINEPPPPPDQPPTPPPIDEPPKPPIKEPPPAHEPPQRLNAAVKPDGSMQY